MRVQNETPWHRDGCETIQYDILVRSLICNNYVLIKWPIYTLKLLIKHNILYSKRFFNMNTKLNGFTDRMFNKMVEFEAVAFRVRLWEEYSDGVLPGA